MPNSWGGKTPRSRGWRAALFVAEGTAVGLVIGFVVHDPAMWVIAAILWVGVTCFFIGMARDPLRTGKLAPRVLVGVFVVTSVVYIVGLVAIGAFS